MCHVPKESPTRALGMGYPYCGNSDLHLASEEAVKRKEMDKKCLKSFMILDL